MSDATERWVLLQPKLEALAAQALTASEIAHRLGLGVTRNAVIGRAHRTGVKLLRTPGGGELRPSAGRS